MASEEAPYKTTVLSGSVDVGIRLVGIVWLLLAIGFWVASFGVWSGTPGSRWWLWMVATMSLLACLASLPEAKIRVGVNLVIVVALIVAARVGWFGFLAG